MKSLKEVTQADGEESRCGGGLILVGWSGKGSLRTEPRAEMLGVGGAGCGL